MAKSSGNTSKYFVAGTSKSGNPKATIVTIIDNMQAYREVCNEGANLIGSGWSLVGFVFVRRDQSKNKKQNREMVVF